MQVRLGVLTSVDTKEQADALAAAVKTLLEGGQFEGVTQANVRLETRSYETGERVDTRADSKVYVPYSFDAETETVEEDAVEGSFSQKLAEKLGF